MSIDNEKVKYFTTSLALLLLSKIISLLFRLGSRVIIARFSSVDVYGTYSVIWNEVNLISIILLIGLGQQLTIKIPRNEKENKNLIVTSAIRFSVVVSILSGLVSLIFWLVGNESSYKYSFLVSFAFIIFLLLQFIFIGLKDFLGFFLLTLSQNLIFVVFLAIFRNQLTVQTLIIFLFISVLSTIIIGMIYLIRKHKIKMKLFQFKKYSLFSFNRKRIYLFIVDIVNSSILYFLLKIPELMVDVTLAAYLNVAFSVISFVLIAPQMISTSMGPRLSEDFVNVKYKSMTPTLRTGLSLIYLLQGSVIILFSYFGNDFILFLYGAEYLKPAYFLYYGFLIGSVLQSLSFPFGFFLRNSDNESKFAIGKIMSFIMFIITQIILILTINDKGIGVTIAYTFSLLILLSYYFLITLKTNKFLMRKDVSKLLLWLVFILATIIGSIFVSYYISNIAFKIGLFILNLLMFLGYLMAFKIIKLNIVVKQILALLKSKVSENSETYNKTEDLQQENINNNQIK